MDRTAIRRPIAIVLLGALLLGVGLSTSSLADAATSDAPIYGVATSIPAFWIGHVLGRDLLRPADRWALPSSATSFAFLATIAAAGGLDPAAALPLAIFAGAVFWPERGFS